MPEVREAEIMAIQSASDEMKELIKKMDQIVAQWKEEDKRYAEKLKPQPQC